MLIKCGGAIGVCEEKFQDPDQDHLQNLTDCPRLKAEILKRLMQTHPQLVE